MGEKGLLYTLIGFAVALLVLTLYVAFGGSSASVDYSKDIQTLKDNDAATSVKLDSIDAKLTSTNSSTNTPSDADSAKLDVLVKESTGTKESVALTLATDEISTKDFRKLVFAVLNSNSVANQSVEDYKDITSIVVRDSEVDVSGSTATVELELKVTYFNDGDTDSEDSEKALITVTLDVSDLKSSDNFKDAELEDYSSSDFEVVKVYD